MLGISLSLLSGKDQMHPGNFHLALNLSYRPFDPPFRSYDSLQKTYFVKYCVGDSRNPTPGTYSKGLPDDDEDLFLHLKTTLNIDFKEEIYRRNIDLPKLDVWELYPVPKRRRYRHHSPFLGGEICDSKIAFDLALCIKHISEGGLTEHDSFDHHVRRSSVLGPIKNILPVKAAPAALDGSRSLAQPYLYQFGALDSF